jgi:hypothetical protein
MLVEDSCQTGWRATKCCYRLLVARDVVLQVVLLPRQALVHCLQLRRLVLLRSGAAACQCNASLLPFA